jgi:hypothetical protein
LFPTTVECDVGTTPDIETLGFEMEYNLTTTPNMMADTHSVIRVRRTSWEIAGVRILGREWASRLVGRKGNIETGEGGGHGRCRRGDNIPN